MHKLTDRELYEAIEYARNIDEKTGSSIIEKFQFEQPALAQTIFSLFPSLIAAQNQDMANLFMDLSFDTLCVYQHAFGNVSPQNDEWLKQEMAILGAEFQAFISDQELDKKITTKLNNRFTENKVTQVRLIEIMNESIADYASESSNRVASIKTTQTMIFTVIGLFNNLYSQTAAHCH